MQTLLKKNVFVFDFKSWYTAAWEVACVRCGTRTTSVSSSLLHRLTEVLKQQADLLAVEAADISINWKHNWRHESESRPTIWHGCLGQRRSFYPHFQPAVGSPSTNQRQKIDSVREASGCIEFPLVVNFWEILWIMNSPKAIHEASYLQELDRWAIT